ncbi:hypothetical protein AA637_04160 [Cyanobacterium sp. HL-69]|uniref:hypothetical protein n=1 Tax=Cyanobacterium sp. HL-69 TaxID=2054282 RepID=UPI000CA3A495|nr:hypothetical protein AA637_04160 [Cyanobacterium sp. HL-69]
MNRFFYSWRSVLIVTSLLTSSCAYLINGGFAGENQVNIETISTLEQDNDVEVKVKGTVKNVIPLVNGYAYEIEDNTGSIWVMTTGEKPEIGQKITSQAMVKREEIIIGEEDMSSFYLKEIVEEETNLSENDMEEEINADDTMESEKDNQTPETDSEG